MKKTMLCVLLAALAAASWAEEEATALVQDFEVEFDINKWPGDAPGEITFSKIWKADGERALKIDAGLMAALENLKVKDWTGYSLLRFHFNNPTGQTVTVGFELQDQNKTFHDRHQNAFGVQPGEQVVDLDFTGGLWRGEENRPYRGKIKTPINVNSITRMSFTNQGKGAIFLDKIQLVKVKKIETPGGFAFDFGRAGAQVMGQFLGVGHNHAYAAAKGYGLLGGQAPTLGNSMSFPTPMLGKGASLQNGFRVDLPGGDYLGIVAFERGGFWEDEWSGYSHAALKVNGAVVSEHDFSPAGCHFLFQDTEITDMAQLADRLIWPAHAISNFKFKAAQGDNTFTTEVKDQAGYPLRVAGLILAPDTAEGKAFLAAHEALQRKVIATTFAAQDQSRRGAGRAEPAKNLICEPLAPGDRVFPRDWPSNANGAPLPEVYAVCGQTVTFQLAVYAKKNLNLTASADGLKGPANLPAPQISHGRYLPGRPYGTGAVWLEINHYRPEPSFTVGAELTRSVVAEYDIPADAKPGDYAGMLKIAGDGEQLALPVKVKVIAAKLPEIPIPVGLFMNALPFPPSMLDAETWWKLQEDLVREQGRWGLNVLSGGPGLDYKVEGGKVSGDNAVKFVHIARKYGMNKAVVPYGGFLPNVKNLRTDLKALADGLKAFEEANQLPPTYLYAYDEPGTAEEKSKVMGPLTSATTVGLKTIGYTSSHFGDELWEKLMQNTYAPALNLHKREDIAKIKAAGKHPWLYNNGADRYGFGLHLWRGLQAGIEGRMQWIGVYTQGFAFHNLDGREPSIGCFAVHNKLGVLKTPLWLSGREGLLDLRIRLALEAVAPKDDAALKAWNTDGYRDDQAKWPDAELDKARQVMLKRLQELSK